nr:MAG TPA: Helix-turn-helix XRE-family like protein [Caudoviricetes sp.]
MNIRKYRIEKGLSQRELGELVGMTQQQIAQYENGKRKPKLETLDKLAKALGVKPGQLYFDEYVVHEHYTHPESLRDMMEKKITLDVDRQALMKAISKAPGTLEQIVTSFTKLNDKGQEKAASYVEDLTKIPEYKKTE